LALAAVAEPTESTAFGYAPGMPSSTDWPLTTRDCADRLGVGTEFIAGEIDDGRLVALVIRRPGKRPIRRISEDGLAQYIRDVSWSCATG
jgi:hypothetical protein